MSSDSLFSDTRRPEPVCECGHGLLAHMHLGWEGHVTMHRGECQCPCLMFVEV